MRILIFTVLIVRSASWLKLKSSHFRKCCEENFYLCVRLMQNHMEIFSTTAKLFVWRWLQVQKAQSLHYWHMGGKKLKSLTNTNIWELYWILSSQMTKTFRDNCDKNIVQQTSYKPLFPDVQMQLKMYFFVPFVCPCMHHNYGGIWESHACKDCVWPIIFWCRALYLLLWRASVSSHDSVIRFNVTFLLLRL